MEKFIKWIDHIGTRYARKAFWYMFFLCIVYIEAGVYFLQKAQWSSATCGVEPSHYHKVLLVADPQILGEASESWIARWDSDRFLYKTFKLALDHVNPSLVIFLGDLMDEGSTASAAEYARYYQRFTDIFRTGTVLVNKTIYIPGDNDIGGEYEEVTPLKLNRFSKYFGLKPDIVSFQNVNFIKVNFMLKLSPSYVPPKFHKNLSIILSHMPLLAGPTFFTEKVIREIRPNLILSAHDHKAVHFVGDVDTGERTLIESMSSSSDHVIYDSKWRFQTSGLHTNEILVPTCSYRMGVKEMAYGVLLIDSEGDNVCYILLWLPNRLLHLRIYFTVIIPGLAFFALIKVLKKLKLPRLF